MLVQIPPNPFKNVKDLSWVFQVLLARATTHAGAAFLRGGFSSLAFCCAFLLGCLNLCPTFPLCGCYSSSCFHGHLATLACWSAVSSVHSREGRNYSVQT